MAAQSVSAPVEPKVEAPIDKVPEHMETDEQAYADDLNEHTEQNGVTWNDTQVNEDRGSKFNDGSAEEESRGVGIKEDG